MPKSFGTVSPQTPCVPMAKSAKGFAPLFQENQQSRMPLCPNRLFRSVTAAMSGVTKYRIFSFNHNLFYLIINHIPNIINYNLYKYIYNTIIRSKFKRKIYLWVDIID
jgi:hypothetical protein